MGEEVVGECAEERDTADLLQSRGPRRGRCVWQVGYWAESVTPVALEPLVAYVQGQRARHSPHAAPESWETNRP